MYSMFDSMVDTISGISNNQLELTSTYSIHLGSVIAGLVVLIGHISFNTVLQYRYYYYNPESVKRWKIQPGKDKSLTESSSWWLPALSHKSDRHPQHYLYATLNLLVASVFMTAAVELILVGKSLVQFDNSGLSRAYLIGSPVVALLLQNAIEYYWHRLMHTSFFYKRLHKIHHYYKSPEPFDDLLVHPLESFGYMFIFHCPAFLMPLTLTGWMAYIGTAGMMGVLDHSGVDVNILSVYSTRDHDRHHEKFTVNYGFPLPVFDILHGTYTGDFLGHSYDCSVARQGGGDDVAPASASVSTGPSGSSVAAADDGLCVEPEEAVCETDNNHNDGSSSDEDDGPLALDATAAVAAAAATAAAASASSSSYGGSNIATIDSLVGGGESSSPRAATLCYVGSGGAATGSRHRYALRQRTH